MIALGLVALLLILNYWNTVYQEKVTQKMILAIREDVARGLVESSFEQYHQNDAGTYISWLSNDVKLIEQQGFKSFYTMLSTVFYTMFALIGLFSLDVFILLATLSSAVIVTQVPKLFNGRLGQAVEKLAQENGRFTSVLEDSFKGYETLFFANRLNFLLGRTSKASDELADESVKFAKVNAKIGNSINGLSMALQVAVGILTGFLGIIGRVTFGALFSSGQLSGMVIYHLSQFTALKVAMQSTQGIFEKFEEFSTQAQGNSVDYQGENYDLQVENLHYKEIFNRFNYKFAHKKKYLLTGTSGSGKTTLFKILSGALPVCKGKIKIGAQTYSGLEKQEINPFIHHVTQDSYLFSGTVYENITLGKEISRKKVAEVLHQLGLSDLSLDMQIDKKGSGLSGGQKQRINIARALLSDTQVLLLDEITANLDKENAEQVERLVSQQEKTVVYITHRAVADTKYKYDEHIELAEI